MAIMIPDSILFPDEKSKEPDLFDQLKEHLSDEYYVFHSLKFYGDEFGRKRDYEADFVILHPDYGLMCIECKSSYGGCLNGECVYPNGTPMSDPYNQARANKYALKQLIEERIDHDASKALSPLKQRQKTFGFYHGVWFGMTKKQFEVAKLNYPLNGSADITLFFDETANPETAAARIEKLYKYSKEQLGDAPKKKMIRLNKDMANALINRILCPTFNIAVLPPSQRSSNRFGRLLREQMTVLDFLEDQRVTVINGHAGSGKTFIAVEKARLLGATGDKVLFLCFNRLLKDYLEKTYTPQNGYDNIHFYTIAQFTNDNAGFNNYLGLYQWLSQGDGFNYKHIIIDEAQDFAQIEENLKKDRTTRNASLIDSFKTLASNSNGCFYLFYDKLQLIQGFGHLPSFINDAECKITLKRNCRNTIEITESLEKTASVSYMYKERQPVSHAQPLIYFEESKRAVSQKIRNLILQYRKQFSSEDIVILSMGSMNSLNPDGRSCLCGLIVDGKYENVPVYTFRQFKGLESECIIIVDMDYDYIHSSKPKAFRKEIYVATSRARSHLYVVTDLTRTQCAELLESKLDAQDAQNAKDAFVRFAAELGMNVSQAT